MGTGAGKFYMKRRGVKLPAEAQDERLWAWNQTLFETARGYEQPWPLSIVPDVREMQLDTGPGRCPFCDHPLKRKGHRWPVMCFRADCQIAYHRAYSVLPARIASQKAQRKRTAERNRAKGLRANGSPRTNGKPGPKT